MPTETGAETKGEKLTRLREDLARVRRTIERAENNGQSFNGGGWSVTQVAYERASEKERMLTRKIATLEASIAGRAAGGHATIYSKMAR